MIKALIKDLFEEIRKPKMKENVEQYILNPILDYVLKTFAPYFFVLCLLLVSIVILLLVTLYRRS